MTRKWEWKRVKDKHVWKRISTREGIGYANKPASLVFVRWECERCGYFVIATNLDNRATEVLLNKEDYRENCPYHMIKRIMEL